MSSHRASGPSGPDEGEEAWRRARRTPANRPRGMSRRDALDAERVRAGKAPRPKKSGPGKFRPLAHRPKPEDPPLTPVQAAGFLIREVFLVLLIALGLSLIIKTYLMQAFFIPSSSMEDTLQVGDRVLVSKLTPGPLTLHRGDIVVFQDPGGWLPPTEKAAASSPAMERIHGALMFVGLMPSDADNHLIKRLIGLPGDKVVCCDDQGRVTVNGTAVDEPYVKPGSAPSEDEFEVTVPADHVWVMGDNRGDSADSRYHRDNADGTVPMDNVVGVAFARVWPLKRMSVLTNPSEVFGGVDSS
ncbi:signal peptidase I [Kineosporia succinea]|uniref:Signal peptidase I n=1 Tax=Kineosporia succinea TaxID=84632 RepID=A0ABT9NWE3_9ACTN|nr:signal peptidase I [Kineosporia succinea]MDP9824738.1 signal peptidase I [Kineosporia succinea]